jgi:hypothetical protein
MLEDKREDGPGYYIDGKTDPQLSRRICDNAAVTLASNHPELRFQLLGKYEDLDRQIAVMQKTLAEPPNATTSPR